MTIQLITFGGLRAVNGAGELPRLLAQHSRAALFVYLAVERHAPRELLTTMFWPESDAENARHALRQSLYQLRKVLGGEWIDSRAHELVVSSAVLADANAFTHALERGDDTRATFAAVAEAGGNTIDAQSADRVALRLGAGLFVLGDVVEAGNTLHIEGAVYDVGADCARSFWRSSTARCTPTVLTRASVSGAADSVFALVDKLAARLLGGLGDPAANRLLRTAALTTNHLPAFKTYLRGEELMRDGRFEQAAEDYLGAIAIDSTFALAHYRLALAREWAPLPGNKDAASSAARHGARLSTRDRDLLYAFRLWRSGNALEAGHAYRAILARYPDDVDAWFQLGEIQFHHEPLLGHALEQSEEAWRKVLSFEPQNLFAITHLARIAIVARRPATLDSLLEEFGAEELHKDRRLYELAILQAVARGDTTAASTFQTRRSVQIFVGSLLFLNCRAADRRRRALRLLKRQRPSSWWQFQSGDGDSPMQLSGSQRRCRYRMPIRQLHVCLNAPRRKLQ